MNGFGSTKLYLSASLTSYARVLFFLKVRTGERHHSFPNFLPSALSF